jgi:phosphohistidine swiveling domain-containing protein
MSQRFTLQLGELRLAKYDLGNKAALLDQIALKDLSNKEFVPERARLIRMPVPTGTIVLDEFFHHAIATGLAHIEGASVVVDDPKGFMDAIELAPITGQVAVRSAFTAEDKSDLSYTGRFETVLNVPIESHDISPSRVRDPEPLADAIAKVWSSAVEGNVSGRKDVLVMQMVDAKYSGVAFTELDYEDDLVNYTDGLAAEMLAGHKEGTAVEIPKLQPVEFPSGAHSNLAFFPRLQMLLRGVRMALGRGNWDVEWADDGERTWIIQVRPITAPTVRNEVFSFSHLKEGLPDLPSRFMSSLIASCGNDIFSMYREIDPTLPSGRNYIEVLYGRPMINVSLAMDWMRQWGEPTANVTSGLGRVPNEAGSNRRRLFRSRANRFALRIQAMKAPGQSKRVAAEIKALSESPGDSLAEVIESARLAYTRLMRHMMQLRTAIGKGYSGSGMSLGTQMYRDLAPMRAMVQASPDIALSLSKGQVPRSIDFRLRWEAWLRKHGHRGIYETDLARPRFRESQMEVLQMIVHPAAEAPLVRRSLLSALMPKSAVAKAVTAREELRFDAMIAFERIRRRLLQLALPKGVSAEMLFSLTIDEVRKLDGDWRPSAEFIQKRREENDALAKLRIPEWIRRNDAIDIAGPSSSLHGVGLTLGEATGKALVLRDPIMKLPEGYTPQETILVVPSVDAGWVPTFGLVGGVVVESGGNLSHGSIILRELGIPSVTNVHGATHDIRSGQRLRVVGSVGRVDVLA